MNDYKRSLRKRIYSEVAKIIEEDLDFIQKNSKLSLFGEPFNYTAEEVLYIYLKLRKGTYPDEYIFDKEPVVLDSIESISKHFIESK